MSATGSSGIRTGKRFSPAGLGFVLTILAEILAFILVGHFIGFGWAFLLLIALSSIGFVLFVRETPRAWREFRTVAAAGERPGPQLTRHLASLVGAVLIALPGFLTAIIGASLFLPPVRKVAGKVVSGYATRRMSSAAAGDLFGPRRVRVKVGKVTRSTDPGSSTASGVAGGTARDTANGSATTTVSEPIEGEILDP